MREINPTLKSSGPWTVAAVVIGLTMLCAIAIGVGARSWYQGKLKPRSATVVEKIHNAPNSAYESRLSRDDDGSLVIELNRVRRDESWCLVVVDEEGTTWNVFVNRYDFETTNVLDSCKVSYYDR